MTDMARLHDMQTIDSYQEKLRRRLLQLQKLLADPAEILEARAESARLEAALHEWDSKRKDAEFAEQGLSQRISASEAKMMGGSIRDPKELQSLQLSVEALRRQRSGVEEQNVEALLNIEDLTARQAAQAVVVKKLEAAWSTRHAEFLAEEAKLKRTAVQLRGQRTRLVEATPPADVALYEDLRRRKSGIAVATIVNGLCSACNMKVPTGVASSARNHSGEVYCTSCGRLLFAPG